MNAIELTRFRKFKKLEKLEFGGITYLVGKNNAGKSTVVKALLLLNEYFKGQGFKYFSFAGGVNSWVNIGNFGRAIHGNVDNGSIHLNIDLKQFHIELTISGQFDDSNGSILQLFILDKDSKHSFFLDFETDSITFAKDMEGDIEMDDNRGEIERLDKEISDLRSGLLSQNLKKSSREYAMKQAEINNLLTKRDTLAKSIADYEALASKFFVSVNTVDDYLDPINDINAYISTAFVNEAYGKYQEAFNEIQQGKKAPANFADLKALKEDGPNIQRSLQRYIDEVVSREHFIFLGTSHYKQSTLFLIRDKSNALAQAIHEFFQLRIQPGDEAFQFVEDWMKKLEVGESFIITPRAGEAYEFEVRDGQKTMHLADKGSGSIQAMLLILRLAVIVQKRRHLQNPVVRNMMKNMEITVLIEEPELNLHPGLQSKLTDMFYECYDKYMMNFIIETHSEYMIRRSQVMVAKQELEVAPNENPFRIYYFPTTGDDAQPYQIKYNPDGTLDKNFGSGFYDEASSTALELIRFKRLSKN